MAARATTVAAAVHRVQLALLDGAAASNEPLLYAAAALLSRADYDDVVTERSIADACGSPVCPSPLPEAAGSKAAPRFHISLREHRVYDLEEARKFCSERCLVASAAFAASLPPDRPYGVPPERLDTLVTLFDGGGEGSGLGFGAGGQNEDEGRKVEIREKEAPGTGEVTLQEWIGPSDAIEGYVPRRDRIGEGPKPESKQNNIGRGAGMAISSSSVETRVSSEVIAKKLDGMVLSENSENTKTKKKEAIKNPLKMFKQDEDNDMLLSCISDSIAKQLEDVVLEEKKDRKKKKATKASSRACKSKPAKRPAESDGHDVDFTSTIVIGDHASAKIDQGTVGQYNFSSSIVADEHPSSSQYASRDSTQAYTEQLHEEFSKAVNIGKYETSDEKVRHSLKSSLKAAGSKNRSQSVTWADENRSVSETSQAYESHSSG